MIQEDSTKKYILDLAMKLFAESGYDSVGVQEICNSCELSKPTLYHHFGSKAGLLRSITEEYGSVFLRNLEVACEYKHDFQNSLTSIYKCVIEYAIQNPLFFKLHNVLMNGPEVSEACSVYKPVSDKIKKLFDDFFSLSVNELGNMRGKEKLYSMMFLNNVNSVALSVLNNQLQIDDGVIYQIVHSFMYGVAA